MERFDVVIVGGGPAGTAAAMEAARHGADAVVIEKGVPRSDRAGGLGPDSTDAAGMLDYWVDIMDIDPADLPDDVILQELDDVEFHGPHESFTLETTGIPSSYDGFGFTFHRARMDDWLRERAVAAGAEYRIGHSVTGVDTSLDDAPRHTVHVADGTDVATDALVLADGPQRRVTMGVLDEFLPNDRKVSNILSPPRANHIAYQEHRRFPDEVFDGDSLKFWWGVMPGETAYPWVFPNDENVARVGLTMPIGMSLDDVENPESYRLLRPDDERIPKGSEYVRRLLEQEYGDEYDIEEDFPVVSDRGKSDGTETYPISSTRPIDSPTKAGIAVAGGAMGTTSAFHEGGYHVAVRSGKIAGELAATNRLADYNERWKDAIGSEILRNVSFADVVSAFEPADWDRAFSVAGSMLRKDDSEELLGWNLSAGWEGLKLLARYKWTRYGYRNGGYVQLSEDEYRF